ncbi:Putative parB partition protein [Candidatus Glomeribacter gigasporarum BEG34]|uniref:Putative parB partition protein n=1 Tax=Candidatus Glomeribacter gigasporarum BEG34 TaxID=1070319 RepID=G2J970_9BURK|nr:ParB/RepB/Spo0J family partition protein [Candidatus Glomeribacter gigasporarum]CCD29317.1 Putative parB partition protein [Candidatus Glomeribacter gigasporarum BEG34]
MGIGDKLLAKTVNIQVKSRSPNALEKSRAPKTSPGRLLDIQGRIVEAETRADELEARLGQALDLPLEEIHEIVDRRRKLTSEQFQELKDNLAKNPLVTPISVVRRPEGGFELIAGHNRVYVYRELGRKSIPAIIQELGDGEADLAAFYSNLLSPALPDLEKYLGFKKRQKQTGFDQQKLAAEAGISKSQVSRIFSYERLPTKAIELLKQHHDLNRLGSNAAEELVRLSKDKEEFVIAAVKRLIEDQRFTQNQAIAFVKASNRKRGEISSEEEHVIHSGKSLFCSVRNRDGILTVRFKNPAIASEWKTKIVQFIQDTLKG